MSLLIIIPAFNEAKMIGQVIDAVKKIRLELKQDILVIDDGSDDTTYQIAKLKQVMVVKHVINRGLGAALATGFEFAKKFGYDLVVTFDADGQHAATDIKKILSPILNKKADVVIGSRLLLPGSMPVFRRLVNYISNLITYIFFQIWTSDSQSGLRAFSLLALKKIKIKTQRMEVSSEIFKEIKNNRLRLAEVPISSIYTDYSLRKGQPLTNAPDVLWKLVLNRFT